jgi:hypothetical protein
MPSSPSTVVTHLDLVIMTDSAVAHLAGALGGLGSLADQVAGVGRLGTIAIGVKVYTASAC